MSRPRAMHRVELVALLAMLMATVAFSIDSMLPALPQIGRDLSPDNPNNAQLVLSSFIIGMGVGTLFTGPMSDSLGRKPVMLGGAALYTLGSALAWAAPSLELMVVARLLQGIGAAGPRIVSLAIVRDFHSGREMARLMSFVMIVFTLFPAIAPFLGTGIIALAGWRGIFAAFVIFSLISSAWLGLRLPEPLPPEKRRPFKARALLAATREMMMIPMVRLSITVQTLIFSALFTSISLIQPVFEQAFDRATSFPLWFFVIGIFCATSSMVNARFVMRYGMRAIVMVTLAVALLLALIMVVVRLAGLPPEVEFWFYLVWQGSVFYQMGLTMGNLNALAMEPLGHIAGTAASVIGAISTVTSGIIASLVAQTFTGTAMPLYLGTLAYTALAFPLILRMRRLERRDEP
ncbi:multidrug effflux MFS transporter [Pseudooceanicola sp.]|uniref:multidrug effflux MFS transporter n=1 Tax=Pseudooceanicola sp. TaxID=1914328 RepID=UPI002603F6A3|nr:multidrug effflux MFS transporter [Pseudooceanicola sp.]MDF1854084.1 multidrug effflux MFS transporter [Pseudooceanicola sp.]